MDRKLYHFSDYYDRSGDVEGIFTATDEHVERASGHEIYMGEIMGKHSEVITTLDDETLKAIPASTEFIEEFDRLFPHGFGHNPVAVHIEAAEYLDEYGY